jgi:hypothetical protein
MYRGTRCPDELTTFDGSRDQCLPRVDQPPVPDHRLNYREKKLRFGLGLLFGLESGVDYKPSLATCLCLLKLGMDRLACPEG